MHKNTLIILILLLFVVCSIPQTYAEPDTVIAEFVVPTVEKCGCTATPDWEPSTCSLSDSK